ncbi:L-lysine 6-monooxygenase (NADPH-requiring)-domain-containing protein [Phlebopus sp. FC_14]|nr:L-lysine 6-monooxygenase (NADPH-requiring)-domain-containing protein [Phlebopus sp. FC_14]
MASIHQVIALGFGPANLAIAGAFLDKASFTWPLDGLLFIERHAEFRWHPGMLLPGARMQIRHPSFLKDLATLRSPQSPITFIAYLHSQNRLLDFINRGSTIPTRKEYSDYLSWAANYVQQKGISVAYGEQVVALHHTDDDTIQVHSRVLATGQLIIRFAKNLIISPGGSPHIPKPLLSVHTHPRIIHTSSYLTSIDPLLHSFPTASPTPRPLRIAVIGSGQSAAEVLLDLHSRLSSIPLKAPDNHSLDIIIRKGSLKPSDDSPFTNQIFDPDATDTIFNLSSPSTRHSVRREYENTNYGVVNPHTLETLYEVMYDQKLDQVIQHRTGHSSRSSKPTICILNYSEILTADTIQSSDGPSAATGSNELSDSVTLTIQHTLTRQIYDKTYDAVFCATGYERKSWLRLLTSSSVAKHFRLNAGLQDSVHLAPESELKNQETATPDVEADMTFEFADNSPDDERPRCNVPSSGSSTPATSLDSSVDSFSPKPRQDSTKLYISRAYRLLPRPSNGPENFKAGIYLQGVAEETHGLSDTLLSVIGVRAGEIVDDICARLASDDNKDISHSRM